MSKTQILAELDRKLAEIEQQRVKLISAREVIEDLLDEDTPLPQNVDTGPESEQVASSQQSSKAGYDFSELSIPDASIVLLRKVGRPMKAREIADALIEGGFPTETDEITKMRNNVSGSLNRRIRDYGDPDLVKIGTSFGLREWSQDDNARDSLFPD